MAVIPGSPVSRSFTQAAADVNGMGDMLKKSGVAFADDALQPSPSLGQAILKGAQTGVKKVKTRYRERMSHLPCANAKAAVPTNRGITRLKMVTHAMNHTGISPLSSERSRV